MSMDCELPGLEGVNNFRELGNLVTRDGRRVRRRRLFRSGHWGSATDSDVAVMAELGIRRVFDFRSEHDIGHEGPDKLPADTRHVPLPTVDPSANTDIRKMIMESELKELREVFGGGGAEAFMRTGAVRLVTDRRETYASFLSQLAEPDAAPTLFHCSAGKDRAGWAASCLLLALGVDEGDVIEHYLLSNAHFDLARQGFRRIAPELAELLGPLAGVRSEYVEASLEQAKRSFGSLDGYFREGLGLATAQLEQLRNNWLKDS